ncbi:MAG: N-acetylglucosamine kinase [Candidatus Kryptoniota bacterium]
MKGQLIFLGFDGGATKTAGAAIDPAGNVVAEASGKASNFQIIGIEKASENILEVSESLLKLANSDFHAVRAIFLGLTGAGRETDRQRMQDGFKSFLAKRGFPVPDVYVDSDAIAALEGAFCGKPGMILISGTGSILFARDENGTIYRVGGWGRFIGDEGSGYAIGRAGLTAAAREFDGRGKPTAISGILNEKFGIDSAQSLIAKIYRENFDIASAAPAVFEAAEKNDPVAIEILEESSNDLLEHVHAILKKTGKSLPIAFAGSILTGRNLLSAKLKELISEKFPDIRVQRAEASPAVGAALLARRKTMEMRN